MVIVWRIKRIFKDSSPNPFWQRVALYVWRTSTYNTSSLNHHHRRHHHLDDKERKERNSSERENGTHKKSYQRTSTREYDTMSHNITFISKTILEGYTFSRFLFLVSNVRGGGMTGKESLLCIPQTFWVQRYGVTAPNAHNFSLSGKSNLLAFSLWEKPSKLQSF